LRFYNPPHVNPSLGTRPSPCLIGPDGRIARVWPKVKAAGHAEAVLAALDELQAAHAS
jgi:peroxiredoxin Q/BCP